MKKIEFFNSLCYSKKTQMKTKLKNVMIGASCLLCTAALVTGTTVLVVNHTANSTGKGGLDYMSRTDIAMAGDIIESSFIPFAEGEFVSDETEDLELSYFSYRVKPDENLSTLAQGFGVTTDTLISVNSIKNSRLLQIGEYIRVPSMPGVLYTVQKDGETIQTITQAYNVDAQKCAIANNIDANQSLNNGRTIFVPDARMDPWQLAEINGDLFKIPIRAKFYYSSAYGWRQSPFDASKRTFHTGLDMACAAWTKIYAASPGKVTYVGINDPTYGNYVVVTHDRGYKTLYGHMIQKPSVYVGQYVDYNTVLGYVGSTGLSTGNHLHFTVYKNGKTVNPRGLLAPK